MLTSPGERRRVVSVLEVAGGALGGRGPGGRPGHVLRGHWGAVGGRGWVHGGVGRTPAARTTSAPQVGGLRGTWQDTGSQVSLLQGSSQRPPCCLPASRAPLPSTSVSSALWCHLRSPRPAPPRAAFVVPGPANPPPRPQAHPRRQLRAPYPSFLFSCP